jgi:hypothetical protein
LDKYRKIIDYYKTSGEKIPRVQVEDVGDWKCRSMMGRQFARIERDYHNSEHILKKLLDHQIKTEEEAWCQLDYTVCKFNIDSNAEMALQRVQEIRQWVAQHQNELEFLTIGELNQVIRTLMIIKKHKTKAGRAKID